jgi:hypothetical protein
VTAPPRPLTAVPTIPRRRKKQMAICRISAHRDGPFDAGSNGHLKEPDASFPICRRAERRCAGRRMLSRLFV